MFICNSFIIYQREGEEKSGLEFSGILYGWVWFVAAQGGGEDKMYGTRQDAGRKMRLMKIFIKLIEFLI